MSTYNTSLFIFRRDLRLNDNTGLNNALAQSEKVIPCFIFDPRQITNKNEYKSDNAVQFMVESLKDLDQQLHQHHARLYIFHGKSEDVVKDLIKHNDIDAVFTNRDYTPFSRERDAAIKKICEQHDVAFEQTADALLNEPELVLKKDGSHYSIFSAFYKRAATIPVAKPAKLQKAHWFSGVINNAESMSFFKKVVPHENKKIACRGGTTHALALLKQLTSLKNYQHDRDFPALNTSHLSAHLKFGTISARQAHSAIIEHLDRSHPLIRQLYWRDFFYPYRISYASSLWPLISQKIR